MNVVKTNIPLSSLLLEESFDYFDCYKSHITSNKDITILDICKSFFSTSPKWVDNLFYLRNKVVKLFGLKTSKISHDKKEIIKNFKGNEGEKIGLFNVLKRNDNEIILGENDKHLNFKVSLLIENNKELTISTVVVFNNWFGRLYFLFVKPFHKLIVPRMLKSILKDLENKNER